MPGGSGLRRIGSFARQGWAVVLGLAAVFAACSTSDGGDDDDTAWPADDGSGDSRTGDDVPADDAPTDGRPDDYLAPWPQSNVPARDYDESPAPGPLRRKAEAYDLWHVENHQPFYGGTVGTIFADDERTVPVAYYDWGDSCEWTGVHLGSQAARYYVTGDPAAKANAILVARALDGYLHVTGTPGFLARYWGRQDPLIYQGHAWCEAEGRCHHVEDGPYAGDFWWGETSRDMYSGWFFGMSLAYDLVDDEPTRDMIRRDVREILNTLIDHNWTILDEAGEPTDAAPSILASFQVSWLTVGYHMTGDERFARVLKSWLANAARRRLRIAGINFLNRYTEYFGNCLSHETWYNLLRLGKVYFSPDDYRYFLELFNEQVHSFTRLTHNPWFTMVYVGQGGHEPGGPPDPYLAQVTQDLNDFPPAPHFRYFLPAKDPATYTPDPLSAFFHDLIEKYPVLEDLVGDIHIQALEPFPVTGYCAADFIFQWSPFVIDACGEDDPRKVDPGVDYLIPYWLASLHGVVTKDQ
jgi:hypothetical protein